MFRGRQILCAAPRAVTLTVSWARCLPPGQRFATEPRPATSPGWLVIWDGCVGRPEIDPLRAGRTSRRRGWKQNQAGLDHLTKSLDRSTLVQSPRSGPTRQETRHVSTPTVRAVRDAAVGRPGRRNDHRDLAKHRHQLGDSADLWQELMRIAAGSSDMGGKPGADPDELARHRRQTPGNVVAGIGGLGSSGIRAASVLLRSSRAARVPAARSGPGPLRDRWRATVIATSERAPAESRHPQLPRPGLVVRRWGSGPEVVLVHGSVTGAHASWADLRQSSRMDSGGPNRRGYRPGRPGQPRGLPR